MSNKVYDFFKILAQVILPFAAMVVAVLGALGYAEYGEVILAIATAVNTFLGVILKIISDHFWKDKEIVEKVEVEEEEDEEEANG